MNARYPTAWLVVLAASLGNVPFARAVDIQVVHAPLVATAGDQITFTARAMFDVEPEAMTIQIIVNGIQVESCDESPCTYTGGPYPSRLDDYVSYAARLRATYPEKAGTGDGCDSDDSAFTVCDEDGYYLTAITDDEYRWQEGALLQARWRGVPAQQEDLVFHWSDGYEGALQAFVKAATKDVNDKMAHQDIIETHLGDFNFWVYLNKAETTDCGTPDPAISQEFSDRDYDAVLHLDGEKKDCANIGLAQFRAMTGNSFAFLHETGHAVFGLGDEYPGPANFDVVQFPEPNIFPSESACREEQQMKKRDPSACRRFSTHGNGWWGIHQGTTVMKSGDVGDAWYTEAAERIRWHFDNL